MSKLVLACDCGTTSLKAILADENGTILAEAGESYALAQPAPGRAEQSPTEIWEAITRAARTVVGQAGADPADVAGLVIAATWKAIVPLDDDGAPLTDAMIWLDSRATEQAQRLNEAMGSFVGTGQEYWPRLMWLKENEPEVWARARHVVGLNTYFKYRATGTLVTEPSDDFLSAPDGGTRERYERIVGAAGLADDVGKFPPCRPSSAEVGTLTEAAAAELRLTTATRVFNGFGDLPAITVGTGSARADGVHIYLGSSSWLVRTVEADGSAGSAPLRFTMGADFHGETYPLQTGCLAYDWAVEQLYRAEKEQLGPGVNELVNREVAEIEAGSENLLATHWLSGELPPLGKNAKGLFLNLTGRHDRRHMVRAVMESICYTHRMNYEQYRAAGGKQLSSIRVVGGGATSDVWMQMLADVLQVTVEVPEGPTHTGAMGAYYCGMVGLGRLPNYAAVADAVRIERRFEPDPAAGVVYDRLFSVYTKLYPALREVFTDLNGDY